MNQNDFLNQLREELQDHPFRERFLEELQDHMEDMEEEGVSNEEWKNRMGEVKMIKRDFIRIIEPYNKLFFVLEGLFYGIFSVPIGILSYSILETILSENPFADPLFTINLILLKIIPLVLLIMVLYFFSFGRLKKINSIIEHKRIIWPILIFLPGFITNIIIEITNTNFPYRSLSNLVVILDGYILLILFGAFIWGKLQKESKPKIESRNYQVVLSKLWKMSLAYLFLSAAFRNILLYLFNQQKTLEGAASLLKLFSPLLFLEQKISSLYGQFIFNISIEASLLNLFYIPTTIAILAGTYSLWKVYKDKKYVTHHGLVVFYLISLLFIDEKQFIDEPNFKFPSINVSTLIEKKITGVFYPAFKYLNTYEVGAFRYQVGVNEDFLMLRNNAGITYYLKIEDLEDGFKKNSYEAIIYEEKTDNFYEKPSEITANYQTDNFYKTFISNLNASTPEEQSKIIPESAILDQSQHWGLFVSPDLHEVYLVNAQP